MNAREEECWSGVKRALGAWEKALAAHLALPRESRAWDSLRPAQERFDAETREALERYRKAKDAEHLEVVR